MKYTGPVVRQPGMYDLVAASDECCVQVYEPSRTLQSQAEEADINTIVKRFNLTGELPKFGEMPTNAVFSEIHDFHTANTVMAQAKQSFMSLPPNIRETFRNDPGLFLDFCSDPGNLPELREMGLFPPSATQEPTSAPPPPDTPPKPDKPG